MVTFNAPSREHEPIQNCSGSPYMSPSKSFSQCRGIGESSYEVMEGRTVPTITELRRDI